ncbi:Hint domain-containing protein [Cribrihabitans marinus]|uniref:Hint domain-containing protein n=1 Tax=Cribrihabitans marinus TaxID=1227549 RepID=A0A1H7AVG8_9RHOB|nr:Hint domain-containing protein [Cribrihabitans marinus]GGH32633.1 hypothetical protein GCM10010973_24250 [Cribrihabitans marinus]SEJ69613.1 Hint domain-containing protein [Cribrihabitans marinus]
MFGWNETAWTEPPEAAGDPPPCEDLLITGQGGFFNGMRVATQGGWRAVGELSAGDRLLTFDHGMQTVVDIQRDTLHLPSPPLDPADSPVLVPPGALFNPQRLWLMPEQGLLVESDTAEDALGDPFVVLPARLLAGLQGIAPARPADVVQITTIAFRQDEVIYCDGGLMAFCPHPEPIGAQRLRRGAGLYRLVAGRAAERIAARLRDHGAVSSVASDPRALPGIQEAPARPGRPERV